MSATAPTRMTADEFIAWAMEQPEGKRYELMAGQVIAMAPERAGHGRVKGATFAALREAIRAGGLSCEAYVDSMSVRVDSTTVYEPDVLVRCGPRLDIQAIEVSDPLIIVEVISPSSRRLDTGIKLEDYFRIQSVRHYLVIKVETRSIVHYQRDESGAIITNVVRNGALHLDPPGIVIADLFTDL